MFKCINLGKINKQAGRLRVSYLWKSTQGVLLLFSFLHLLFCYRLPGCQAVNDHYKLNRLFGLKRKPKGKITAGAGAAGGGGSWGGSTIGYIGKKAIVKGMILGGGI